MQRRKNPQQLARIRVVGVGSGGKTAVNGILASGLFGIDCLAIDMDVGSLSESQAPFRLRIGQNSFDGRGAAGDPGRGRRAAIASKAVIDQALFGSDMVFILAGLGGGTGSGAGPVVAEIAKQQGALVVGIVTFPFPFEGQQRITTARQGVSALRKWTDTLIVIPNDRLLQLADGAIGFHETYRMAHDIWFQSIQGIGELLGNSGVINVDFADVRAIMAEGGGAVIASGRGKGRDRARLAAESAARSDLLGITIDGAHGLLFNISGGPDMNLLEIEEAADILTGRAHPDANVIFGAAVNHTLEDEIRITVIATGFTFSQGEAGVDPVAQRHPIRQAPVPLTHPDLTDDL